MPPRLSSDEFARLARQAIASLPEQFRRHLHNVAIDIQPRPSRRLLREMDLDENDELLGVYHGVPLTEKSVSDPVEWPHSITLFQRSIEDVCESTADIVEEIRQTILHEVGHHFGMDEDDLEALGY